MSRKFFITFVFLFLFAASAQAGIEEGRAAFEEKDWLTAVTELRPLAEAGDGDAMVLLGKMYASGFDVEQDYAQAFALYSRAAEEKGNLEAMVSIASMHVSGIGAEKSKSKALPYAKRAAEGGHQAGAFLYASILADAENPDFYNAYKWYGIAARGKDYPQFQQTAEILASRIARDRLTPEDKNRADAEISAWKPIPPDAR